MSGAGRKSHYRKAVTDDVLNSFPLPDPENGLHVVRVLQSNGGNIFQIQFGDEQTGLAMMPTKFRKLIWVKRGDFVMVSQSTEQIERRNSSSGGVQSIITHILYHDQMRHIAKNGALPPLFDSEAITSSGAEGRSSGAANLSTSSASAAASSEASAATAPSAELGQMSLGTPAAASDRLIEREDNFTLEVRAPSSDSPPDGLPLAPHARLSDQVGPAAPGTANAAPPTPPMIDGQTKERETTSKNGEGASAAVTTGSSPDLAELGNQSDQGGALTGEANISQGTPQSMGQGTEAGSEEEYEEEEEDPDDFLINTNRMNAMLPPDDESSDDDDY